MTESHSCTPQEVRPMDGFHRDGSKLKTPESYSNFANFGEKWWDSIQRIRGNTTKITQALRLTRTPSLPTFICCEESPPEIHFVYPKTLQTFTRNFYTHQISIDTEAAEFTSFWVNHLLNTLVACPLANVCKLHKFGFQKKVLLHHCTHFSINFW